MSSDCFDLLFSDPIYMGTLQITRQIMFRIDQEKVLEFVPPAASDCQKKQTGEQIYVCDYI
ncbi:hypothetical protein Hdeb2414_s0012g00391701 [Helianthus debilis subsp. tardiflorus]